MLKPQTQQLPYIAVFKLGSGEEFIAKVVDEDMGKYVLSKPLCIVPSQQGLSFAPFMMLANPEKTINLPKPMITAEPSENILQQYESAITGIAVPKKPTIIA